MSFQNYVCWDVERVQKIMNVEAVQPPEYIFLAIHHPMKMKKGQLIRELIDDNAGIEYSERDIFQDFLEPENFAFVPILGESGTGKSHLIRWLYTAIPETEKRKVLLIPKIGTNLKDIIQMILELTELQGENFDEYRKRLNRATYSLDEKEAREQLLNQLAIAVGENKRRDRNKLTDFEDYLIEELPAFLYDPFFRQFWLQEEGIIHRLVTHIFGNSDRLDIVEERREFSLADLPINLSNLKKAGEQAREFYSGLLSDDELQQETVNWLNQHLDEAIAKVLDLGSEDLLRLMREVRETLAEQKLELILLIEDFAKLQGIDREVLEAVLARPQASGNKPLCAIRTALACTTGYFRNLADTVHGRISFSVNLDVGSVGDRNVITQADLQQFTARYLNAVRLEDRQLQDWFSQQQEGYKNTQPVPNFCENCEHRQPCHAGFGSVNEIGLYPFTPQSLQQMLIRVNPDNFKPRYFIRDTLKYVLENSSTAIQKGYFPTPTIKEHFGKMRLNAIVQDEIKRKDRQNGDRRQILIDLWSNSTTLCDFAPEIHTAFNLPPLGEQKHQEAITYSPKIEEKIAPRVQGNIEIEETKLPEKLTKHLETLDNWNNQAILPQDTEKEIREFIYPTILERIDWDAEMLLKGSFASSTKIFKQKNILVYSPRVRGKGAHYSGIILNLPLNPDNEREFRETAIAFQGILQYKHYKHWNFPDGDRYFLLYAKYLDRWSQNILEQIRSYPRIDRQPWNPVPATVELLAIGAQMSQLSTSSLEDLINSLFLDIDEKDGKNCGKIWRELLQILSKDRKKLQDLLKSYIGCTKGSVSTFQMIDIVQILQPLKTIRKLGKPQEEILGELNKEYQVIQKVRQKVDEILLSAIIEERDRKLETYHSLVAEFGQNVKKDDIIARINEAIDVSREAGVFVGVNIEELQKMINLFKQTRFQGYLDTMQKIESYGNDIEGNLALLISGLSENSDREISRTSEFLERVTDFLNRSFNKAQEQMQDLQLIQTGEKIEEIHQNIQNDLAELEKYLTDLRG